MTRPLPFDRPVLFPLWAVLDDGSCGCGVDDCDRVGKHPRVKWGEWREEGQPPADGNYAIKTGARATGGSNVFVVDADDAAAVEEVKRLNGGELPNTFTVATGRGAHFYIELPDFPVRRSVHELHAKIDIVGERWWVVGPGSKHKSGAIYTVTNAAPPMPCPAWLRDWPGLRARPVEETQTYAGDVTDPDDIEYRRVLFANHCRKAPPSVQGDGGDLALWKVVQHGAVDLRLPNGVIYDVMREHFDPRCSPPWGEALKERVQHKAHSAKTQSTRPGKEPLSLNVAKMTGRLAPPQLEPLPLVENRTLLQRVTDGDAPEIEGRIIPDEHEWNDVAEFTAPDANAAPTTARPPTPLLSFDFGIWDTEPPPIEFLVDGLLPRGAIAMFYGRADSMKTWLLYAMAKALAEGKPFLGTYNTKRSRVGIIDYETGQSNVHRRLYMLRAGKNENLGAVSFSKLKPNTPEFWEALAEYKFDVVFVDSLRRANQGGDENDSGEAIIPLELAAEFSEATGCAVVFIHHAKKASQDGWPEFRGSAAIEDQVDCAYAVRKTDVGATKKTVEIRCEKPGDMRTPDPFAADVEFDDVRKLASITLCTEEAVRAAKTAETKTLQTEIKKVLTGASPLKPAHWQSIKAMLSDNTPTEITAAMEHLLENGDVTKLTAMGGGKFFLDSERGRRDRTFEAIDTCSYKTIATLADAACVTTDYVKRLIRSGVVLFAAGQFSAPKSERNGA